MKPPRAIFSRQRVLNALRGIRQPPQLPESTSAPKRQQQQYCYKHFPLASHHVELLGSSSSSRTSVTATPEEFHSTLCQRIRSAKRRVYLASLYIGPAVDRQAFPREAELLDAIGHAKKQNHVNVKLLLDLNRALRPVQVSKNDAKELDEKHETATTTSSAKACLEALGTSSSPSKNNTESDTPNVFLISALTDFWQTILTNPYNELMGVFHIKAYIVDDTLILSGANLSEEYFVDRHDRYLSIQQGGNGLVDFYAQLVEVLCQHARVFTQDGVGPATSTSPAVLLESVADIVMTTNESTIKDSAKPTIDVDQPQDAIVAVAVPTFQAPSSFGSTPRLRSDVDAMQDLLQASSSTSSKTETTQQAALRLATAYLNPTKLMLAAIDGFPRVQFLTAGQVSHGFKPKDKPGNKGKVWIPAVFDEIARSIRSGKISVWFYQRPDWTFHAKGLWLSMVPTSSNETLDKKKNLDDSLPIAENEDLKVVTHGSGNFGARSEQRDFESNLVLLFPPRSPLAEQHKQEWNEMSDHAAHFSREPSAQLSLPFKVILPTIRSFF